MIYSPVFILCHSLLEEEILKENSISVYCLWAETYLPQQPAHNSLTALWCLSSKKNRQYLFHPSADKSPRQHPLLAQQLQLKMHFSSALRYGNNKEKGSKWSCTPLFLCQSCLHPDGRALPWRKRHFHQCILFTFSCSNTKSFLWELNLLGNDVSGCFRLGLAWKRWQRDKSSISCQKMWAQTCTEFTSTQQAVILHK